jgi:hypothetical protein
VKLDYVGSLRNAAAVISRLYGGEKRLVVVDSRSRAEQLGRELRALEVTAFVTHSSPSADERRRAEEAFAGRDDCVIVATSVLGLGVDVGDLHRVIQIDAPSTVSSFLQRMGRTGRRPGASRNCLFLATDDDSLLRAAGLIGLWAGGYVEPVTPPPEPYHVLAQQVMALCLQERGIGRRDWAAWVGGVPGFAAMPDAHPREVIDWMLSRGLLWEDGGLLLLGRRGEEEFGRKNFMDLFSVFTSPTLRQSGRCWPSGRGWSWPAEPASPWRPPTRPPRRPRRPPTSRSRNSAARAVPPAHPGDRRHDPPQRPRERRRCLPVHYRVEPVAVQGREHPVEGVGAGDPGGPRQEPLEPALPRLPEPLDLLEAVGGRVRPYRIGMSGPPPVRVGAGGVAV